MSELGRVAGAAARNLTELGAPYALIGGIAVSVRTQPRFTQDLDLAVAVNGDPMAESLVHDLSVRGYQVIASVEHANQDRLATVRLSDPTGSQIVDLLFASSGIEPEIVAHAQLLRVWGSSLPVARTGHLIAMKLLARDDNTRPLDAIDLRALVAAADESERELAREAVELIHERGFNRDRDLRADLHELLEA